MPRFQPAQLQGAIVAVFRACGVDDGSARVVADHLIDAEMCGVTSHGLIRVPQYVSALEEGKVSPRAQLHVVRENESTAVLDGGHGFGQVMASAAMEMAVGKARVTGVGAVTLVNCSHTGRLASYTAQAAEAGMLAMMMVNAGGSGQWVAPFGGTTGRLSTNPISFAAPTANGPPLVVDFATSAAPEGRVRAALNASQQLPAGWVIDHRGQPTVDPADLYGPPRGAILPFGGPQGHKGFGLALVVELFAGALSGAGVCRADAPHESATDGVFMLAVDPSWFGPPADFLAQVRSLIEHVKSSPPAPGVEAVLLPGEKELLAKQAALASGIVIEDGVWKAIQQTLDRFGITVET